MFLVRLRGDVEAVYDPRIVFLKLEHARPGGIDFHGESFVLWIEVDRPLAPGVIGERAPLSGDQRRMITILMPLIWISQFLENY